MKATIQTNDRNLFHSLLELFKSIHVSVETEDVKLKHKSKRFDPREYEGILSHLNLNIEKELKNMRNAWKKRSS